ncbi:hypothetical protein AgCh_034134 [Apium graveolens]
MTSSNPRSNRIYVFPSISDETTSDETTSDDTSEQEEVISRKRKRESEAGLSRSNASAPVIDDFHFPALLDDEEGIPVTDENFANQMQLQEVLMSTVISSTFRDMQPSQEDSTRFNKGKKIAENNFGQSSQSRSLCNICFDHKRIGEMFPNTSCRHTFCKDCISKYVASKIQANVTTINCPDTNCREGDIGPDSCREIVPREVLERWDNVLCESLIIGSQKFYCPFQDCSALMLDDGEEKVTASECPNCRRLFCAQCKVAWHSGIDCVQFKNLNKKERENGDIMLMEIAKSKKWRRCPKCKYFVEKINGCADMNFAMDVDRDILKFMNVHPRGLLEEEKD